MRHARMLRKFLILSMIIFTVLPVFVMWWKTTESAPQSKISTEILPPVNPVTKSHPLIKQLNASNAQIKSFSCSRVNVRVWQNGMRFRLDGELHYEKANNFRMYFRSIFGKEVDLGSNERIFWYWSRRDKERGLYYARYEDFQNTRLKSPFNPIFIRESLGLNDIVTDNASIMETDDNVVVFAKFVNGIGKTVFRYTFLNKANQKLIGSLVTDESGNPIAISEILEYDGIAPKRILYTWYEENQILYLEFVDPVVNAQIDPSQWQLPNIHPQINMGGK
jgi:hypothetical protein